LCYTGRWEFTNPVTTTIESAHLQTAGSEEMKEALDQEGSVFSKFTRLEPQTSLYSIIYRSYKTKTDPGVILTIISRKWRYEIDYIIYIREHNLKIGGLTRRENVQQDIGAAGWIGIIGLQP
jgi:hypothetical protein